MAARSHNHRTASDAAMLLISNQANWIIFRSAALISCFLLHCLLATQTFAVNSELRVASAPPSSIDSSIDLAKQHIARLQHLIDEAGATDRSLKEHLVDELQLWEEVELVLAQRKSIQEDIDSLERAIDGIDPASAITEVDPRSYLELDDLRDLLSSKRRQLELMRSESDAEKAMLVNSKRRYQEAEHERRLLVDALQDENATDERQLSRKRSLQTLSCRLLAHRLELGREQVLLTASRIKSAEREIRRMEATLSAHAGKFRMTRNELETRLATIEELEHQLRQQLLAVNARLRALMQRFDSNRSTANRTAYQVAHAESELLQQMLSEANHLRDCWENRYRLSNGDVSAIETAQWLTDTEQAKQRLSHIHEKVRSRLSQREALLRLVGKPELVNADSNLASAKTPSLVADADLDRAQQVGELERVIGVYQDIQLLAASSERMYERFIEDLRARGRHFSFAEWGQLITSGIAQVWNSELATIDDEPITMRKIVFGCLLLLCGYFFSRAFASRVAYRVLPKFGLSEPTASVLRTVLFYLLLTVLTFVTLDIVSVPMTAFAFVGGAVAIGLGFGSQNLINNFISGLILLVERPIRVGDLVNVDGIDANVTNIGARCTRVRTGANLEILVPNSKFLENNVTNWTLSDTRVRTSVSVGVAYGSPVRRVITELRRVIDQHEQIIKTPEPIVLFHDFGDSALTFEVHFWIHMQRMMDGAKVRSEIRVAIDEAFAEADIVIAFPQRDVHVDMQAPIEVKLANTGGLRRSESYPRKAA